MKLNFGTTQVQAFSLVPRTTDLAAYWKNILRITHLSDKYGYSGVLIFNGNDVAVEPWLVAQSMILNSTSLVPLVAVNPVYMHPFTTAKMISSLAYAYERRVALNLITGTALSYLAALGDKVVAHDERYQRLLEYATVVKLLLAGDRVTFTGKFYSVEVLQLVPRLPSHLLPSYLVAGQSEQARLVAREVGAATMQMLEPDLKSGAQHSRAVNLGILTRATEAEAWRAAREKFPENEDGQVILAESMHNTDAEWKRRLTIIAKQEKIAAPGYWMGPFKNFQADQPYFVGSHQQTAALLTGLVREGVDTFVLDLLPDEEEFANVNAAFAIAAQELPQGEARDPLHARPVTSQPCDPGRTEFSPTAREGHTEPAHALQG